MDHFALSQLDSCRVEHRGLPPDPADLPGLLLLYHVALIGSLILGKCARGEELTRGGWVRYIAASSQCDQDRRRHCRLRFRAG